MPRLLTATVVLVAALVITPRLVSQSPQSTTRTLAQTSAGLAPGTGPSTDPAALAQPSGGVQPATLPEGTPLAPMAALPEAVRQDLAAFAASQGLDNPPRLQGWGSDLNGDGREDLLVEADFGQDGAGRALIYHFPYFAEAEGFRRGSSLSLGETITAVGRDGRALIVSLGERRLRLAF